MKKRIIIFALLLGIGLGGLGFLREEALAVREDAICRYPDSCQRLDKLEKALENGDIDEAEAEEYLKLIRKAYEEGRLPRKKLSSCQELKGYPRNEERCLGFRKNHMNHRGNHSHRRGHGRKFKIGR